MLRAVSSEKPGFLTNSWALLTYFVVNFLLATSAYAFIYVGEVPFPNQSATWQLRFADVCNPGGDTSLCDDLKRVQRIIQSPAKTLTLLETLDDAVENLRGGKVDAWEALEEALADMEARHMFPAARVVYLDIVPPADFLRNLKQAFVVADVGPGLPHGEFSHRLQWAAIMIDFESNQAAWSHTPYELFVRLGERDSNPALPVGRVHFWSHLFDQAGYAAEPNGAGSHRPSWNPAMPNPDGFRHPDRLNWIFGRNAGAGLSPNVQNIAEGVAQRHKQRLLDVNDEIARLRANGIKGNSFNNPVNNADIKFRGLVFEGARQVMASRLAGQNFKMVAPALMVHADDVNDYKAETPAVSQYRVTLSRIKFGKPAHGGAPDARTTTMTILNKPDDYPSDIVQLAKMLIGKKKPKQGRFETKVRSAIAPRKVDHILPAPTGSELARMGKLGGPPYLPTP
ncbi:MAG: LirA/MavJ family T4SS effector [Pseudomonadota bacterium]